MATIEKTASKAILTEVFTRFPPRTLPLYYSGWLSVCACFSLQRCQALLCTATHLGQSETVQIDDMQKHLRVPFHLYMHKKVMCGYAGRAPLKQNKKEKICREKPAT